MSGAGFLLAFGATWLVCAAFWARASAKVASLVTLFQGMVALPIALGLTAWMTSVGPSGEIPAEFTQMTILVALSQQLGLPVVIYLIVQGRYLLTPFLFVSIVSMHFVMYSWIYQTPLYIVMAVALVIAATVITAVRGGVFAEGETIERPAHRGPMLVCLSTAVIMLATAATFLVQHLG